MLSLDTVVRQWLSALKIGVSSRYLKHLLHTRPDFPSMLCITDTLEELGIDYAAVQIEKEQLPDIPVPFLAHLTGNRGEWVIVRNRDDLNNQFANFFERWQGIVLAAENTEGWSNPENERELEKERRFRLLIWVVSFAALLFATGSLLTSGTISQAVFLLTSVGGVMISWLIVSKELGIENKLADQVCAATADCAGTLRSKAAKLPVGLSWGDVGMTWFSFQLLFLLFSFFSGNGLVAHSLFSICAIFYIPFVVFSLFYQGQIGKKWCRLCLIIVGVLIVQAGLLIPKTVLKGPQWPGYNAIAMALILLAFGTIGWLCIKKLLVDKKQLQVANWGLQRFKNSADVFLSNLTKQRRVDIIPWDHDLQIGNSEGVVQIVVACNPYCRPCAKTHKLLHELLEKDEELGLTIRFIVDADNKTDKRTMVVEHFLQLVEDRRKMNSYQELQEFEKNLLHNWFEWMDYEKFEQHYPLNDRLDVHYILQQLENWGAEANITATPTIFINGYELPKEYSIGDLSRLTRWLGSSIIENHIKHSSLVGV